jgi:hypothetical protein
MRGKPFVADCAQINADWESKNLYHLFRAIRGKVFSFPIRAYPRSSAAKSFLLLLFSVFPRLCGRFFCDLWLPGVSITEVTCA